MNTFYKVLLSIFAVAVLGIGGVYVYKTVIEKPSEDVIEVESVILSQNNITLKVGENIVLSAIVNPDNASDKTVNWTSSNPAVATVSNGVVQALSEGTTAVMATTTNNQMAICNVVVTKEVTETPDDGKVEVEQVILDFTDITLKVNDNEILTPTIVPSNAEDKTITWESTNTNVVTVKNGVVTAVGTGNAVVIATSKNGKVATCKVTVTEDEGNNDSEKTYELRGLLGKTYNALGNQPLSNSSVNSIDAILNYANIKPIVMTVSETFTSSSYITNSYEYFNSMSQSWDTSISAGLKLRLFSLGMEAKFGKESIKTVKETDSSYCAIFEISAPRYKYTLNLNEKNASKLWTKDQKGNYNSLDADFVDDLLNLDPATFFNKYGTHIIIGYRAGGYAQASYIGNSRSVAETVQEKTSTNTKTALDIKTIASVKNEFNSEMNKETSTSASSIMKETSMKVYGGTGLYTSFDSLITGNADSNINGWLSSLSNKDGVLDESMAEILTDENLQLMEIWDLLGTEYQDRKVELEEYYESQMSVCKEEFNNNYSFEKKTVDYKNTASDISVGSSKIAIRHKGHYGMWGKVFPDNSDSKGMYHSEDIDLSKYSGCQNSQYKYIFTVTITLSEKHDGYQLIYLYDNDDFHDNSSESKSQAIKYGLVSQINGNIAEKEIEHDPSGVNEKPKEYTWVWEVSGDNVNEHMYIRYDAEGNYDDTWWLHAIKVHVDIVEKDK